MSEEPGRRIAENPFYVLGLPCTCERVEVEREGQRWLAMLELGHAGASTYPTPLGARDRTPELVRWAMAELRDPDRRLAHELWAALPPEPVAAVGGAAKAGARPAPAPWEDAFRAIGWGQP